MKKENKEFCVKHGITENQFLGKEKIGGSIDLSSLTSIPKEFNPTVGGYLDLSSNLSAKTKPYKIKILTFNIGKYILVDGIFTEVLQKRGNVYKVKKINEPKEFYLVSNKEETFFAHGDTLKKAKEDLEFKIISETIKNSPIKADTVIDMKYYRLITGACEIGVKNFIETHDLKASYKAKDLLPILEKSNAYGLSKFKSLIKF